MVEMINNLEEDFVTQLDEAETAWYNGCMKHTKLSGLIRLWT